MFISNSSLGQNQENDLEPIDTVIEKQIISYLDRAWELMNVDIDSMYYFDNKAIKLAQLYGFEEYLANSHVQLASYFEIKGDYDSAVYHHYQGITIYQNNESLRRGFVNAYYNLAATFE